MNRDNDENGLMVQQRSNRDLTTYDHSSLDGEMFLQVSIALICSN